MHLFKSDLDWDFRGADTKRMTHGIHTYPAMMIPQIAERLLNEFGGNAKTLLDPFCGTGTSLLEANLKNITAIGCDLNPLARLIARVKTTAIGKKKLHSLLTRIREKIESKGKQNTLHTPKIKNIDLWFPQQAQKDLSFLLSIIKQEQDNDIRRFLLVVFSDTARKCSYTRHNEFKLYRIPESQRKVFLPNAFMIFQQKLVHNINAAIRYSQAQCTAHSDIKAIDCAHQELPKADIVITSPPYGDSRTTVAYGQFSRFANEWMGIENAAAIDRNLLGGKIHDGGETPLGCAALEQAIADIDKQCWRRAREVRAFYVDYKRSIANIAAAVNPGGFACYVVGNRCVKGVQLPTDLATRDYFIDNGFHLHKIYTRSIPNKRMPSKNSPTNIAGQTSITMTKEYIIVLQKPKRRQVKEKSIVSAPYYGLAKTKDRESIPPSVSIS